MGDVFLYVWVVVFMGMLSYMFGDLGFVGDLLWYLFPFW